MSEHDDTQHRIALALTQMTHGQVPQAIETLKEVLGEDPEHATAHALLAHCLIDSKRLNAAEVEARLAVEHDPEEPLALTAVAQVAIARRRFDEAKDALTRAAELDSDNAEIHCQLARLYGLWGKHGEAETALAAALEIDPDDPSVLACAAARALERGSLADARKYAMAALAADPACHDALVTMGRLELYAGNVDSAREHAVFAMMQNPSGEDALRLFAGIKARQSPLLGLWWRWNVWMHSQGTANSIRLLLAFFALYRLTAILLRHYGHDGAARAIEYLWLAFCIYTWVGPSMFARMIARELEGVQLKAGY